MLLQFQINNLNQNLKRVKVEPTNFQIKIIVSAIFKNFVREELNKIISDKTIDLSMRQARRIYGKSKDKELQNSTSSIFKSKIMRDLPNQSKVSSIGPGQYEISFPIVKPKFEAFRKNNNTIIIKVNDKGSSFFQSLQPRFKEQKVSKIENNSIDQQAASIHQRAQGKSIQTQKISNGMKTRIQRLSQILSFQNKQSKKQLAKDLLKHKSDKFKSVNDGTQAINSLKLYKKERQRLHFLLKYIKPNNLRKGVQWSKYRQTKGNLYTVNNVPGPGAYQQKDYRTTNNRYFETIQDKSWQFKSLTKRGYYQDKQQKKYQVSPLRNRFVSDINGKFYKVDSIPVLHSKSRQKLSIDQGQT